LGYSPWSEWCKPVAPQAGVWLKSYNAQELSMLIEWFIPVINSSHREIESYELQICNIQGQYVISHPPLSSSSVASKKKLFNINRTEINDHSKPSQEINEFITLSSTINENCYLVKHLKAGRKYQFRVRAKIREVPEEEEAGEDCVEDGGEKKNESEATHRRGINGEDEDGWPSWETLSVISEMIQMSSTIPDAPKLLRPAIVFQSNHSTQTSGSRKDLEKEKKTVFVYNPVNIAYDQIVEDEKKYINYGHTITEHSSASAVEQGKLDVEGEEDRKEEERVDLRRDDIGVISNSLVGDSNSESLLHPYPSEVSIANSLSSEYQLPKTKIDLSDSFDISHNSITLTFTNGDSNGEIIEAYEIQLTKIRNYHFQDILHAKEAFLGIAEDDGDEEASDDDEQEFVGDERNTIRKQSYEERMTQNLQHAFVLNSEIQDKEETTSASSSQVGKESSKKASKFNVTASSGLQWITVFNNENEPHLEEKILSQQLTASSASSISSLLVPSYHSVYRVEIVGKQRYRINNLLPGNVYIFRIRAKNKLGWSPYSHSSPLISTFPSIPPEKPLVVVKQQSFVIICWKEMNGTPATSPSKSSALLKKDSETTELVANTDKSSALFATALQQEEVFMDNKVYGNSLTTLEYQIQIRKISFNRLHATNYLSTEMDGNSVLLEYLGDWDFINSQVLTRQQLSQQLLSSVGTVPLISLIPAHDMASTLGKSDDEPLKYIVLSNLIEFNWYIIRIRIRTILGWSPWSEAGDPFRMEK
jgi:hypothetical protein